MSELLRSTLGDYALAQELWGAWSGITIKRDSETSSSPMSRRECMQLLLQAGVATGGLLAARTLENFAVPWELSSEERQQYINKAAAYEDQEFGIHPDFEYPTLEDPDPEAWSKSLEFLQSLEGDHFATVFVTLQDCEIPVAMEKTRRRIHAMLKRNIRPLISLGLRKRGMVGHPFDTVNERQLIDWMKRWAQFLHGFKDVPLDIRFLFEMQVPPLSWVTYARSWNMDEEIHAERFRYLHTLMYHFTQTLGINDLRFVLCGSSAGGSLLPYVPSEGVGAIGTDLFDFSGGKTNPFALINLVFGLSYVTQEVDRTVADVKEASILAGNVPMYLCEIGSLSHDVPWTERTLLKAFSNGFKGAGWLNYDKSYTKRPTETDWNVTPEILSMLVNLQSAIRTARARN